MKQGGQRAIASMWGGQRLVVWVFTQFKHSISKREAKDKKAIGHYIIHYTVLADLTVNESGTMWMDGAKMALWCKTVVSIFVVVSIWQGLLCDMVHKEMVPNVWAALKEVLKPTMLALRELMFALAL